MQRFFSVMITLILSTTLVLTACGSDAQAKDKVYTLKLATWFPAEGHLMSGLVKDWIKAMEERSNGRIKIAYFPAGQIAKLKQTLDVCSSGAVDITGVVPQIMAGQLPLNTFITLPYWTTAVEGTEIYERTYAAVPELEQEFAKYGLKKLSAYTCSQYDIGTVTKQVRTPEDLKGLKISVTGGFMNNIAARYGIHSMSFGPTDLYEALQKNIIEGAILSHVSTNGYKVYELEKYLTNGLRMGSVVTDYVINEKSWQKLPEDLQNILLETSQEFARNTAIKWDSESSKLLKKFEAQGTTVFNITAEDRALWNAPLKGIENEWIEEMSAKGLPAQKTFDVFIKIANEVAK